MIWTAQDIIKATSGTLIGNDNWHVTGLSLDNRKTNSGDLFVALEGENHDGHDYANAAFEAGAVAALVDKKIDSAIPQIITNNSLDALVDLAKAARQRCPAPIVAITGSVGKTGTKTIIAACLTALGQTHASRGNYNNHIGAPLSLALMPADTEYGVFELGMNHAGEIAALSPMVAPEIAIITRISNSHGGHFNSIDDIAAAKAEIFSGLASNGVAILNADDPYLDFLSKQAQNAGAKKVITCGHAETADCQIIATDRRDHGITVKANIFGQAIDFDMGFVARHWALSGVMALAVVAHLYEGDQDKINKAALALASTGDIEGRGKRHVIPTLKGQVTIIDDSYNASPASMVAALQCLGEDNPSGRKIAVLGDMLELGDQAPDLHRDLVGTIQSTTPDMLICFGEAMAHLAKAVQSQCPDIDVVFCDDADHASAITCERFEDGDLILIKGSNGMKTSTVVQSILGMDQTPENGGHHAA